MATLGREDRRACHGVGDVVVAAWHVIDRVLTGARRAALQTAKLSNETLVVEQFDAAAVQQRQQAEIKLAFHLVATAAFATIPK